MTNLILRNAYRIWRRNGKTFTTFAATDNLDDGELISTVIMNINALGLLGPTLPLGVQFVDDPFNAEMVLIVPLGLPRSWNINKLYQKLDALVCKNCDGYIDCAFGLIEGFGRDCEDFLEVDPVCVLEWAAQYRSAYWITETKLVIPRSKAAGLLLRHRWLG